MMAPRNVDELVFYVPTMRGRRDASARGFAASIRVQARRRNWRPSEKQLKKRRLVSDLFAETDDDERS